jgi:hypothetical protein
MIDTWQQTIADPNKITARHLQKKGTNDGSSLLISMVAKQMLFMGDKKENDEPLIKAYGTSLQFHSVPHLIKALKYDSILQSLHHTITHNQYPTPIETELSPSAIPTLFQHNEHPYTAMDDIEAITPQELKTIIATYCERFYPQATRQSLKPLQNITEEEIRQILQTTMALRKMIVKAGIELTFNPPTISDLISQRDANTKSPPINWDSPDQIQAIEPNTTTFRAQTRESKIQTIL